MTDKPAKTIEELTAETERQTIKQNKAYRREDTATEMTALGGIAELAKGFEKAHRNEFDLTTNRHKKTGETWVDFTKAKLQAEPHWLGLRSDGDASHMNVKDLDLALNGNVSAYGRLVQQHTEARVLAAFRERGKTGIHDKRAPTPIGNKSATDHTTKPAGDARKNPWLRTPENIDKHGWYTANALTRQGAIAKSLGIEKAQQIAKSAGSFVGAVK